MAVKPRSGEQLYEVKCSESTSCLRIGLNQASIHGMNYAILRTQKLKSEASVWRSLKHAFRAQTTPNADPSKASNNAHLGASSAAEAMQKLRNRLPEKRRKDAVLVIEYLITASPEAMAKLGPKGRDDYFNDSMDWLRKRHGSENVVYAGIHRDETTPHMYAYVVPLDESTGRLNCKHWLGGAKALKEMQTEFAEQVGKPRGLQRGQEGSKARHESVKSWYARVGSVVPKKPVVELPGPSMADRLKPSAFVEKVREAAMVKIHGAHKLALAKQQKAEELQKRVDLLEAMPSLKRADQAEMRLFEAERKMNDIDKERQEYELRIELLERNLRQSEDYRLELAERNNELLEQQRYER